MSKFHYWVASEGAFIHPDPYEDGAKALARAEEERHNDPELEVVTVVVVDVS